MSERLDASSDDLIDAMPVMWIDSLIPPGVDPFTQADAASFSYFCRWGFREEHLVDEIQHCVALRTFRMFSFYFIRLGSGLVYWLLCARFALSFADHCLAFPPLFRVRSCAPLQADHIAPASLPANGSPREATGRPLR